MSGFVPDVGTQLGHYRLETVLGRGGMGVVYRAVDLQLGRKVALKLLASDLAGDERFRTRFLGESRLAASIDHPGIVPIFEAGEADGHLYIAMRYVQGTDLASLLHREGPLAPERAVGLVAQLGDALEAAHACGLVHRDVKPSNALIAVESSAEHLYLADFGLTKHLGRDDAMTATGQLVGTVDYLAPERIRGEDVDGRADIYALGCVLFECLTGEVPFRRDSDVAAFYAHLEDDPPRPSDRRGDVPADLDAVVTRALAKHPDDRLQSAAEFSAAARVALSAATLVSAARVPGRSLPRPPNRTIGRERDIAAVAERLLCAPGRLVTLTGPGGVGKSRLALEVARAVEPEFTDGSQFVSLAAVPRAGDVAAAIVQRLGIVLVSAASPEQAVLRFLAAKHLLLVTDNFEHLLAGAPFIADLLAGCPRVAVLATSREPLALGAEERYPVAPLALPDLDACGGAEELGGVAAIALFTERARAQDRAFALGEGNAGAVAQICRRVDGLPLAIELAAARCGLLSPGEITQRLDAVLGALGTGARDAPARQQTLRATIDWSHNLLGEAEQAAFARFAVFAGGVTVAAAETVTGADLDTLERLVAKSLLVRRHTANTPSRLRMLETIRAYAGERFADVADRDAVRERHFRFFLALAQRHGADRALWGTDSAEHLAQLEADSDNIHGALRWACDQGDAQRALAMCAAMGCYWELRDRNGDAMEWVERALSLPGAEAHLALRVRVLCHQTWFIWRLGRVRDAPAVSAEAEAIARTLAIPALLVHALATRSWREAAADRTDVAEALADEALHWATVSGGEWELAEAFHAKAPLASTPAELRERVARADALLQEVGNVYQRVNLLGTAAYKAVRLGGDQDALEFITRAASLAGDRDDKSMQMFIHGNAGLAALLTGDTETAQDAFRTELRLCRELVVPAFAAEGLLGLGAIAAGRGDARRAARLVGAASAHGHEQTDADIRARLAASFFDPARRRARAAAWGADVRDGAALSFDEAIAYALQSPASRPGRTPSRPA